MMSRARVWLLMLVCGLVLAAALPAGAQAIGIEKFVATNCEEKECGEETVEGFKEPKPIATAEEKEELTEEGFSQAGGRVPFGVTDFLVASIPGTKYPEKIPAAATTHIRTDVAPGLATNPFAVKLCSQTDFGGGPKGSPLAAAGLFGAPDAECKESEIGEQQATIYTGSIAKKEGAGDVPVEGLVYDLETTESETMRPGGPHLAALYGVAVKLPKFLTEPELKAHFEAEPLPEGPGGPAEKKATEEFLIKNQWYSHSLIKGNVEWGKEALGTGAADYHDYFEIESAASPPLLRSRLTFFGQRGNGAFITNATSCPGHLTTNLTLEGPALAGPEAGKVGSTRSSFTTPSGLTGCNALEFPINFGFHPSTTTTDSPNEFTAEASIEHNPKANDVSQVKQATFRLPPGMTLNPSAANGLAGCKPSQAHEIAGTEKFTEEFGVACPAASQIATVSLNVPTLPDGSLTGAAYLGQPEGGPITAPPFTMYVVANSAKFGVSVRLVAHVSPDLATGQVTTTFSSPPEQPFTNLAISFNRNALAPIANPLLCGEVKGAAVFEPTSAPGSLKTDPFGQTITGCNSSPPPFKPAQKTTNSNGNAGASTNFTFNLARNDGEMYVGSIKTELPPGLVGKISIAERCQEPAASSETAACPTTSQIGTATVLAGSGSQPFSFSGPVYLTGPYNGSPYGLSIKVPAVAGPFNFGTVVTRAGITVDPFTSQVIVENTLPRIRQGVPLRIKNISVAVNKSGFMINPTNCGAFKTVSTVGGFSTLEPGGATGSALAESPFQVANCNALKFAPKFKASSNAKTSRTNGASLVTEVTQSAGQANIKFVKVQLPRSLPSRLTTLQKACPEQVFNVNPLRCGSGAFVGGAVVHTPTLPQPLRGPAILVSHANAAFPDLDLVVEDPNHLRVILVGNTNIKNSITTTTFASTPDVPVSSVRVELPIGSHSALAAFGNICAKSLVMPTTMTAQNGKTFKQNTIINVAGCPVEIVGRKVVGNFVFITARVPAAGRVSVSGLYLHTTTAKAKKAFQNVTLKVPLNSAGRSKKPLTVHVRVGFVPKKGKHSTATTKVSFH
jgi:hypothetical protein